ncbi:uncharacterized protein N7511_004551 [Penicillium nucicola]|uniref:uncharacterized protein n=1 Tax=Penicillium nucicola TaxID=1850975 RepID=UPI002545699B|nr:uncharacterized protein N7511_004551 [Penicillium nucicola]KAJ5766935.1 hypothetical protein N7511_004551 [Penicillium nucicola]
MASGPPALLLFGTSDFYPRSCPRLNGELNTLEAVPRLTYMQANLPNLRRLFVEARTEAEENEYSRTAFYNLVLFISSVAVFSLVAQRMSGPKTGR